jgi:hypothetical protein
MTAGNGNIKKRTSSALEVLEHEPKHLRDESWVTTFAAFGDYCSC